MKRILLATLGTIAGLVGLLSFKSHGHAIGPGAALPSAALPATSTAPTAPTAPGRGGTSTSAPPQPSASGAAASGSAAPAGRSIAGQAVQTRYGVVQIQLTVTATKITNVSYLQLTAVDDRSQQINSYAAPILLQETLAAQNANIDTVSGATYTSEGYIQSLQSALDQAGIR